MRNQKIISILLICFTSFLFYSSCRKDVYIDINNPIDKKGWTLTFDDEFTDTVLNRTYWITHHRWADQQEGTPHCFRPQNVTLKDGKLYLMIKPEKLTCWCGGLHNQCSADYSAGMVTSSAYFTQKYGYWEARIKTPKGKGIGYAFWMVSLESWPPEIDVFDNRGQEPDKMYMGTIVTEEGKIKKTREHRYSVDLSLEFHTYAIEWSEKYVKWYLDNTLIYKTHKAIPHKPMFVQVSTGTGGFSDWPDSTTIFPNYMIVDYIRVYKKNE